MILHDIIVDVRIGAEILVHNPGIAVGYVWPVGPEVPTTMKTTVPMAIPVATPTTSEPPIGRDPPCPPILAPLLLLSTPTRALLLYQGPIPPARSAEPRPTTSLTPLVYAPPILSPPVFVSDPSKFGVTAAVAVSAEVKNPNIEVKEADKDDNSVNFMVYAGAVFGGLLLMGGGHCTLNGLHDQDGEAEGGKTGGIINREKEGNRHQCRSPGYPNQC